MPALIVVSGTPGVGKSSIAQKLSEAIPNSRHVDVSNLVKRRKLFSRVDESRTTLVADEKRLAVAVARLLEDSGGGLLILSTHYVGGYIPKSETSRCFVLRLNPRLLEKRLSSRGWSLAKIRENVEAELVGVCLYEAVGYFGRRKVHELDTTGKSEGEVMKQIVGLLDGKKRYKGYGKPGGVDWLNSYVFRNLRNSRS